MSSGSSESNNESSTQAAVMQPVPTATFDTSQAQNAGRTYVPQTYTKAAKPAWMTGAWDMPTWGTNAATGADLTQPVKPVSQPVVQQQQTQQQQTPSYVQDRSIYHNASQANGGIVEGDSAYSPGSANYSINPAELFRQQMLAAYGVDIEKGNTKGNSNILTLR